MKVRGPLHLKITSPVAEEESLYLLALKKSLNTILPPGFFPKELDKNPHLRAQAVERWHQLLPLIEWTPLKKPPFYLSFFLCCPFRQNAFRFFQEMICRWLIPGTGIDAFLQFAINFYIPDLCNTQYLAGQVVVNIETLKELELVEKNLPILETEIRLGMQSAYQANRILEIKGLSSDEKTGMIQENIAMLVKHRPQDFDYDLFSEMQHLLVFCKEEFKHPRSYKHMSRLICFFYLFRKALMHSSEAFPERRFVSVKLIRVTLLQHNVKRRVLGVVIGLSFLRENEIFTQRHILKAIKSYIPNTRVIKGSFFKNASRHNPTCLAYLEVEKEDESPFTIDETSGLKEELPHAIGECIEKSYNLIFMPQNEEEVFRGILALSNQLTYMRDLPQAMISFEKQTESHLEFLVIVVRIVKPASIPIQDLFETRPTFLHFIPDRIKVVGLLRKKYRKEANVFRLQAKKDHYLRHDHSVDLYKARSEVAEELARIVGEFRDFNGGTISKENELFANLRKLVGKKGQEHAFLLENFFYSLGPAVMRSVLKPVPLKKLFFMLLEAAHFEGKEREAIEMRTLEDREFSYMVLLSKEPYFRTEVLSAIERTITDGSQVATCFVTHNGLFCMGILDRIIAHESALKLRFAIESVLTN